MEKTESENAKKEPARSIFTQKSMDHIYGPEELNDYVRVTTPSVWIVLTAITLLVIGILGWSFFGTVAVHEEDGTVNEVHPITFVMN
jgi:hypothetical protein